MRLMGSVFLCSLLFSLCLPAGAQDRNSETDPALKRYLEKHPEADTDGDGVLSSWEKEQHLPREILDDFAGEGRHEHAEIPMRDGVTLPAEVFLPPGEGPFPVVMCRTAYGRWGTGRYAKGFGEEGIAFVACDIRQYEGGRHDVFESKSGIRHEILDGADTLKWIKAQPWCNGRIGSVGGSGNGYAAEIAVWANDPAYLICGTGNTTGHLRYYWAFHNQVRRLEYRWLRHRGAETPAWPRPTLPSEWDPDGWLDFMARRAPECPTIYKNDTGWYDPMLQGILDTYSALAPHARAYVRIWPRGHGGISGVPALGDHYPKDWPKSPSPSVSDVLKGKADPDEPSMLAYYLMGDTVADDAPGNEWKYTEEWPVPHTPTAFYLAADSGVVRRPPGPGHARSYRYDPAEPAPSLGGHYTWSNKKSGPHDQRPLFDRPDVLTFESEPLSEPLTITGPIRARLFVESSAPDTAFVVKLLDIYPDGTAAIVRETAGMLRYRTGADGTQPWEGTGVAELDLDLWSTALVFNRGHRIGVLVTSSSDPAYEVHPNTFAPARGPADMTVATNAVRVGGDYASRIILPVID